MKSFDDFLWYNFACRDAVIWVQGRGFKRAWRSCDHPNWMVWYLDKVNAKVKPLKELVKEWLKSDKEFKEEWKLFECKLNNSNGLFLHELENVLNVLYENKTNNKKLCNDIRAAYPEPPDWK